MHIWYHRIAENLPRRCIFIHEQIEWHLVVARGRKTMSQNLCPTFGGLLRFPWRIYASIPQCRTLWNGCVNSSLLIYVHCVPRLGLVYMCTLCTKFPRKNIRSPANILAWHASSNVGSHFTSDISTLYIDCYCKWSVTIDIFGGEGVTVQLVPVLP